MISTCISLTENHCDALCDTETTWIYHTVPQSNSCSVLAEIQQVQSGDMTLAMDIAIGWTQSSIRPLFSV